MPHSTVHRAQFAYWHRALCSLHTGRIGRYLAPLAPWDCQEHKGFYFLYPVVLLCR